MAPSPNLPTSQLPASIYRQHIGGQWQDAANGNVWHVLNPATEQIVETVPFGDADDADAAIEAAAAAFSAWSRATAYERAAYLQRIASLIRAEAPCLARTTTLESGKPLPQSIGEWLVAADLFDWFAEEGKRAYGRVIPARTVSKRLLTIRQPLGVVGVITAWNFPIYNIARAAAAALAAGCSVVVRPSEYTPLTAMELLNLAVAAGLPPGVLNLISGEPGPMAQTMLAHPSLAKIHFTGSPRVGRILMDGASQTITRLSLELGGNAPVLLFPDIDPEAMAASAVTAKFRNCGQVCVAPQRFLVHESIAPAFLSAASAATAKLRVGPGLEPETNVGPLINAAQRDRVESAVGAAIAAGAKLHAGGHRLDGRGYFYQPTVLSDVTPQSQLYSEEIFGPVLPVTTFSNTEEAIELANSTRYGLAAYVFTQNLTAAIRTCEQLHFGMVGLNEWTPQATEAPFAGWKESGVGRESGAEGLEEYLETKLIAIGGI